VREILRHLGGPGSGERNDLEKRERSHILETGDAQIRNELNIRNTCKGKLSSIERQEWVTRKERIVAGRERFHESRSTYMHKWDLKREESTDAGKLLYQLRAKE